jgi:DNA-binding CsgD family transcriptional regulator/PAS domain-containing protein
MATISRIHAAGLDPAKWPHALSGIAALIGGHGASLEMMERPSLRHTGMYTHDLPAVAPFMEYYASICPRIPHGARAPAGSIQFDFQHIDDAGIDAHPFYMEFLADFDMRYSISGVVTTSPREFVIAGVQFSSKQGHPASAQIRLMKLLLPHVQQATDVMRRLGTHAAAECAFERALDWLTDGVFMLGADGAVHYANLAAQEIARANDGIAIRGGLIEFVSGDAKLKLAMALRAIGELRDARPETRMWGDFLVDRRSGAARYAVSVRPLLGGAADHNAAVALILIHDPMILNNTAVELFQHAFGLTPAEAEVANGLRSGLSADAYARRRKVSPNTVYTHIRRIREKTGCTRMAELIRKLNDVQLPVVAMRR